MPATPDLDPNATSGADATSSTVAAPPAADRYALGDEIARGGMGAVYRATDTTLGRELAVKVLQEKFAPDSGTARRFADEARIAAQLQHPGIPPIHDYGTLADGRPFLAMKLIKGDTLDDLLKQRRDPGDDRGRFVAAFEAVCQAVAYAHANGVIHRDLKPANVMVGKFGEVQVMDWGLAKIMRSAEGGVRHAEPDRPGLLTPQSEIRIPRSDDAEQTTDHPRAEEPTDDRTQVGVAIGTPAYMPPEQARGDIELVDRRADVFALGGVLCAILTSKPPYSGPTGEVMRKAAAADLGDAFARLDGCGADDELVAVCWACLHPDPAARPADAGVVAVQVGAYLVGVEERLRAAERDRAAAAARTVEQKKKKRVQLALAAAVGLMAVGAAAAGWWWDREAQSARVRARQNADAVANLLEQARVALEAGDADRATLFLDQADRRAADDGVAAHADRRADYRAALSLLRDLDAVDDYRWTPVENRRPSHKEVVARWSTVLTGFEIVPGTTPPEQVAERIRSSPVRAVITAVLDGWLAAGGGEPVKAMLAATDPDPFRDEVRIRMVAGDGAGLIALADLPEWLNQPSGLVVAWATAPVIPANDARRILTRAAVQWPVNFTVMMQLGQTYPINTSKGAPERSRWYQAAVSIRPTNAVAHNNLGIALKNMSDFDGATSAFLQSIRFAPNFATPHSNLGLVLFDKGDYAGAVSAHREAIRLAPTYANAHNNLGAALGRRGDVGLALASFRDAIRIDPTLPHPHVNLGELLFQKGDLDGALVAFQDAIRIAPHFVRQHDGLGNVLQRKGDLDGAVAAYREAIRLDPSFASPHNGLGNVLRRKGDLDGAVAEFSEAIRLDRNLDYPHYNIGLVRQGKGDLDGAAAAFREAVRLNPGGVKNRSALGTLLNKVGRPTEALAEFQELARREPGVALWHDWVAFLLLGVGDGPGALTAAREATRLDPGNGQARHNLGRAELMTGDPVAAWVSLREAGRLDMRNVGARNGLGDVERRLGRLNEAVAAYREALAVEPQNAYARQQLAYCQRVLRGEVPTAPPPRAVVRP